MKKALKISELEEKLKLAKEKLGDVEVLAWDNGGIAFKISDVDIDEYSNKVILTNE